MYMYIQHAEMCNLPHRQFAAQKDVVCQVTCIYRALCRYVVWPGHLRSYLGSSVGENPNIRLEQRALWVQILPKVEHFENDCLSELWYVALHCL